MKIIATHLGMAGVTMGLLACTTPHESSDPTDGGSESASEEETEVTIYSWWESAAESAALDALSAAFVDRHPNVDVRLVSERSPTGEPMSVVIDRYLAGEVMDVSVIFPPQLPLLTQFTADGGAPRNLLRPLDELMAATGAREAIPAEILAGSTSSDGTYIAPLGLHRVNNLFFNKTVLANLGVDPPRTLDDFADLCERIDGYNLDKPEGEKIYGIVNAPIGWTLGIVFHSLLAGGADSVTPGSGGRYVDAFFHGRASIDDPEFRAAAEILNTVLECSNQPEAVYQYACHGGETPGDYCLSDDDCGSGGTCPVKVCRGGDHDGTTCETDGVCGGGSCVFNYHHEWDFTFEHAIDIFRNERSATFIMGDWLKGELDAAGFQDYGVIPAFGSDELFFYNQDSLGAFVESPRAENADAFMRIALSPEGQAAFGVEKGATPARRDAPTEAFDSVARATMEQYRNAKYLLNVDRAGPWNVSDTLRDYWRARHRDAFASSGAQYEADLAWLMEQFRTQYENVKAAAGAS